ncbi:ABC transporter ATP-binding protein [Parvularcula dongshanensis]|uniref:Iron(III) transport system ATP-binding protein n=1 Tax=Parvularcula dongshanensis TaxID=1173995 RepID=A0A840I545_9PROT|nr:ABC transporter ATP-binding protein [Parvularcula dongshanensis]MBB4659403.1 iron(III) transport system ATP-binding protein [Parvularcula dongshanensis]
MSLEIADLSHSYGEGTVLRSLSLGAAPGEITCLLGASGCGKTTLLRLIAGLLPVQAGELRLDGKVLAGPGRNPPPEKRPVGLVFQEGALFPHLSVAGNVGFGLVGGVRRNRARIEALLDQIGLREKADAYPNDLSGGQQQRVALARALAPSPSVVLLDEPFASVDVVRRHALREEMRSALRARGAISILVTHDPDEAMAIGDKIAVMEAGRIVQADTPATLYDAPATAAVGTLFGDGQLVRARRAGDSLVTPFGVWPTAGMMALPEEAVLDVLVRPEALLLEPNPVAPARIEDVRVLGRCLRITVRAETGEALAVEAPRSEAATLDERVSIRPKLGAGRAFGVPAAETPSPPPSGPSEASSPGATGWVGATPKVGPLRSRG